MFKTMLIAVDMSHPEQLPILMEAAIRIVDENEPAQVHLLYVDDSQIHQASFPQLNESSSSRRKEIKVKLQQMADTLMAGSEHITTECHIRKGSVHEQILEESKLLKVDMVLMMASRPGLASYFVGSNAERVVRHAQCSVLILRND